MKKTIKLINEYIEAEINLIGAELISIAKIQQNNLLWVKNEQYWNRVAPILFPIVGKLKDDSYRINDKRYSMKQHGFARDLEFKVVEQTTNKVELILVETKETRKHYPFSFSLSVEYKLVGQSIQIFYKTINTGKEMLPYSVGGHPGFEINLPIENYKLNFYKSFISDRWKIIDGLYSEETEKMIIDGYLSLTKDLFMHDAIVFKRPPFSKVTLENNQSEKIVTLGSENWEAIGLWTKPGAPFFCIEPWWGWADNQNASGDLLQKSGIHYLEPSKSEIVSYYIEVH